MRANSRVFTEKTDMFEGIQIDNCPSVFRSVAERLILMITKPGYSVPDYNTVNELDRLLTLHFWKEYDAIDLNNFDKWYLTIATSSDVITRARRWLIEHNYIFLKPDVQEHAMEASNQWKHAIRH